MGRLILLVVVCLVVIGTLFTFRVPLDWVGHLPGDFSLKWGATLVYIPVTTSLIFSFLLTVFLFMFSRR